MLQVAGVVVVVFVGAELNGVHEDAGNYAVAFLYGTLHQRHMTFVQSAHGGRKTDGEPLSFPFGDLCLHFGNSGDDFHCFPFVVLSNDEGSHETSLRCAAPQ